MGTVEWSELLRWIPRGTQDDSGQALQTPDPLDIKAPAAPAEGNAPAAPIAAERRKPTLASL
jgi:hypothetical protein